MLPDSVAVQAYNADLPHVMELLAQVHQEGGSSGDVKHQDIQWKNHGLEQLSHSHGSVIGLNESHSHGRVCLCRSEKKVKTAKV